MSGDIAFVRNEDGTISAPHGIPHSHVVSASFLRSCHPAYVTVDWEVMQLAYHLREGDQVFSLSKAGFRDDLVATRILGSS